MTPTRTTRSCITRALATLAPMLAVLSPTGRVQGQQPLPDSLRTRVDPVFARWDHTNTPGCAVGISQSGHTVYERGYGMSDLQHGLAITSNSIFHVASISKQFAAYSVALLARDGKLRLDDDVRKYVKEIPDYGKPITIRQMIYHVSGLRDQWQLLGLAGWRFPEVLITEDDVLGMTHTHFHDDHTMIVPGRTSAYEPRDGGGWSISIPVFDTYGATSLFTTAGDLLTWMHNLDVPTVGDEALVANAQTSAVLNDGTQAGYGYGLSLGTYRGLRAIGHGGADAGYRAQVERYPERGLAIAVLCNASTTGPNVLLRRTADVLLGNSAPLQMAAVDTVPRLVSTTARARWVGTYRDTISQLVIRVRAKGDTLVLDDGRRLVTTSDSTVRIAGSGGGFVLRGVGASPGALVQLPRATRDLVFGRETPVVTTKALLEQYAGSYFSDELDARYVLVPGDSTLVVKHRKLQGAEMSPAFTDAFTANFGATALFVRDKTKHVTGFILSDGRVRGLLFAKER